MSKKRRTPPNNGADFLPLLMADDVAEMLTDLETDMLRTIAERVRKRQHLPDYMVTTV